MGRSPPLRVQCLQLIALFGLAFAAPPPQKGLGLPHALTRRLIKQKARHHRQGALTPCRHMVSGSISLRSQRFFSPFPRGTCSLSVARLVFSLCRGRRWFMRSFTCAALLRKSLGVVWFSITGLSPSMERFSIRFIYRFNCHVGLLQPRRESLRFGLFRFRSPLLTESHLLSFPPVTEMFHFTGIACPLLCIRSGTIQY
jgi:hypothetical protein